MQTPHMTLGNAPLHNAAMRGLEEIIEMLLHYGARIGEKDFSQNTPLQLATWNHRASTSKILLERGSFADYRDHTLAPED